MAKHKVNGVVYYTSGLLDDAGIKHGFFTRAGGVSPPPFGGLNMSVNSGDSYENVRNNRQLMCEALGLDPAKLVFARNLQHEDRVRLIKPSDAGTETKDPDGLITKSRELPLGLCVADCIPIILADPVLGVTGIIHAGWRGIVAGIISSSVQAMQQLGSKTPDIRAALGPAIAANSYEVGQDFIDAVSPGFSSFLASRNGRRHFDLLGAAQQQLQRLGVNQIDRLQIDTFTNTNEFYSHRAEGTTGRFGAVVSL